MTLLSSTLAPYFICTMYLIPIFALTSPQTYSNMTLGSSFIAGPLSSQLLSPSKAFAFGFRELEPGSFLLAIWFNKIPERTIVWSANRDHLVPKGSKVSLTSERSLILTDPNGLEIWRANLLLHGGDFNLAYAAMLNTGNFVLMSHSSVVPIIWQSFNEPTDTLLLTQMFNIGSRLTASVSSKNYSSGRFSFELDNNGHLGMYTTNYPFRNTVIKSSYQTFEDHGLGFQVIFSESGLHLSDDYQGGVLAYIFSNDEIVDESNILYQRVSLEYDGVLRHYVYKESFGWLVKSFTPENICKALQKTGFDICGIHSCCKLGDDKKSHCLCLPGYTLRF